MVIGTPAADSDPARAAVTNLGLRWISLANWLRGLPLLPLSTMLDTLQLARQIWINA